MVLGVRRMAEKPNEMGLATTPHYNTVWGKTNFKTGALNYSATLPTQQAKSRSH